MHYTFLTLLNFNKEFINVSLDKFLSPPWCETIKIKDTLACGTQNARASKGK